MRVIKIESIEMQNFKGFARANRVFVDGNNEITAENGQGKTTYRYAFLWVLGFDVPDVIPMIDNREIPELEISVEMSMLIDGYNYVFKRVQNEVWRTNKSTGERNKEGNKSTYWLDGIPYEGSQRNYKEKVATIFGTAYDKLEMLINKDYFNSDSLNWKDRRRVLFDLCKVDDVLKSLADKPEYELIATDIKKGYETIDIKKALAKERLACKGKQESNDIIIRDRQAEIARYSDYDFAALETQKNKLQSRLTRLQTQSRREQKNEVLQSKITELSTIITELSKAQIAESNRQAAAQKGLREAYDRLSRVKTEAERVKSDNKRSYTAIEGLAAKRSEIEARVYKGESLCPCCGQDYPADRIATAKANFEKSQKVELEQLKTDIAAYENHIKLNDKKIDEFRVQYKALEVAYNERKAEADQTVEDKLIADLTVQKEQIQAEISSLKVADVKTETDDKVKATQAELSEVISTLTYKNIITDIKSKIQTLREHNQDLADKIAFVDKKEAQLTAFILEQVSLVNETINSKFDGGVSFALFKELYRGGDGGLDEDCTCMLNGKRYTSLSTGERYFADLEVVKALQREYDVNLPIFCDNAEAVTKDLRAEQQIIKLFALKGKKLDGVMPITNIL